jgi:hypothetical protein
MRAWLSRGLVVASLALAGCGKTEPTGAPPPTAEDIEKSKKAPSPEQQKWEHDRNWERNPDKSKHPPP